MLQSFPANNSNLSDMMHTQGKALSVSGMLLTCILGSTYLCWAFSCASMLRSSCSILIKALCEAGKINEEKKSECLAFIMEDRNHETIRKLIAMILLPKKLHKNDQSQSAYLKAAVSRVSYFTKIVFQLYFRLLILQYLKMKVH